MADCKHLDLDATVAVNRLEDTGRFMADVRIWCKECRRPFQFLGLPLGLNLEGATMDADGQQARLAIAPVGSVPQPLDGVLGFGVRQQIADCRKRDKMLSAWDADFLDSIENRLNENRTLTPKQIETLDGIWEKETSRG